MQKIELMSKVEHDQYFVTDVLDLNYNVTDLFKIVFNCKIRVTI